MLRTERVRALAAPLAAELELDLVDVEFVTEAGRHVLRITIDRPDGISHEHCEALSRRLDAAIDAAAAMGEQPYNLEVSSPGAERPLKTPEDFQRFAGRRIALKGKAPIEGRRQWKGQLIRLVDDAVVVQTEVGELTVPRQQLAQIRLSLD